MKKADVEALYDARLQALHVLQGCATDAVSPRPMDVESIHRLINGCVAAHDLLYEAGKAFYEQRTVA